MAVIPLIPILHFVSLVLCGTVVMSGLDLVVLKNQGQVQ